MQEVEGRRLTRLDVDAEAFSRVREIVEWGRVLEKRVMGWRRFRSLSSSFHF